MRSGGERPVLLPGQAGEHERDDHHRGPDQAAREVDVSRPDQDQQQGDIDRYDEQRVEP
jgi:hypothetical protein